MKQKTNSSPSESGAPMGSGPGGALDPCHGVLGVSPGPEQLRLLLATAILGAEIDHNPPGEKRSLGYYASAGIDYFGHPHDALGKLALAAADAVLRELEAARAQ